MKTAPFNTADYLDSREAIEAYVAETSAEIERLLGVVEIAADLVALWQSQKVAGLPRADRNAAIEESRERLIKALVEIEYHSTDKNAAATARAAIALDDAHQQSTRETQK